MEQEVFQRESNGLRPVCAREILLETRWLRDSTADFARIDRRLQDLREALSRSSEKAFTNAKNSRDGDYTSCYTEWFFQLDALYDYQKQHHLKSVPAFLDRVNSPEKFQRYVASIATSDVAHAGVDHRRELNEALADLVRLILHDQPAGYSWAPRMKAAARKIVLDQLRNPQTGWWGARYVHEGNVYFVDDLSITFHMLSYLPGSIPNLDRVVATALALKDLNYPQGWLDEGRYTNHNNMDAAVLFHYGWPFASAAQRAEMSGEIDRMLAWCLKKSLQPDGSFRRSGDDDSVEESEYFGAAFLSRVGYFDTQRRFWTKQDFPEAAKVRSRIQRYIERHQATGAAGGVYYANALEQLNLVGDQRP